MGISQILHDTAFIWLSTNTSEPTFVLLVMCRIEETLSLHSTFIIFTLNKPLDDANISSELLVD